MQLSTITTTLSDFIQTSPLNRVHDLADLLKQGGYEAVFPTVDPRFKIINRRSNWSERHTAFIAGLGTISLNCSLITKAGAAGRLGSVITNLELQATDK